MQTYIDGDSFRRTAFCDCGWHGRTRWSRGSAEFDAALHAAQSGHYLPEFPTLPWEPVAFLKAS